MEEGKVSADHLNTVAHLKIIASWFHFLSFPLYHKILIHHCGEKLPRWNEKCFLLRTHVVHTWVCSTLYLQEFLFWQFHEKGVWGILKHNPCILSDEITKGWVMAPIFIAFIQEKTTQRKQINHTVRKFVQNFSHTVALSAATCQKTTVSQQT